MFSKAITFWNVDDYIWNVSEWVTVRYFIYYKDPTTIDTIDCLVFQTTKLNKNYAKGNNDWKSNITTRTIKTSMVSWCCISHTT